MKIRFKVNFNTDPPSSIMKTIMIDIRWLKVNFYEIRGGKPVFLQSVERDSESTITLDMPVTFSFTNKI